MKLIHKLGIASFVVGFYVGCAPVSFSLDTEKCANAGVSCVVQDGKYRFDYKATAGYGKVDILIVDDNSASMSFEQARVADRFQNFIQDLDARNIDYRIAITTTDVSGGAFPQGGSLIGFGSGMPFLTPLVADRVNLFKNALRRQETLNCEQFIANWFRTHSVSSSSSAEYATQYTANCPSGDERGVYAANLVVQKNPSTFIRGDAHLSVIFMADEDERSGLYTKDAAGNVPYPLENLDQPATLISNIRAQYGEDKFNSLSLHAIVVKDSTCLSTQNNQTLGNPANSVTTGMVSGSYGNVYLKFTNLGWGNAADICSTDYTSQLGQIRSLITDRIKNIMLACSNPESLTVTMSGNNINYHVSGKSLILDQTLSPGSTISLSYLCSSL